MPVCGQAHAPQVPHLSRKLPLLFKMSKNRREHCRYYSCGAHHTDAPSSNLEIQHFVNTWGGLLRGAHRANRMSGSAHENLQKIEHTICAVLTTQMELRMRFTRSTPYKSPKGAIYVVYAARMRFTRCTPYKSPKGAIYVDSNANYAVHTAQLAQGPLPRHAHRSLPGPLSRAPGHDRAEMIIFRTESTTFGR